MPPLLRELTLSLSATSQNVHRTTNPITHRGRPCSDPLNSAEYPYRKDVTVPSVHFFASQHHFSRGCPGALLLPRVPSLGPSVHLCVQTLLAEFRWMRISGSRRGNEGRWVVLRCGALVLFVCDSHISLLAWIRDTARDQWACVTQSVALL